MGFREKSAWVMSFAFLLGGALYLSAVVSTWSESHQLSSPLMSQMLMYTASLVLLAVVGHIIIAAFAPRDANAPADERDRQILSRAGHYSSYVSAVGIMLSLGTYLLFNSGDLLFYAVFASLLMGQIAEYFFQIFFYRTSI